MLIKKLQLLDFMGLKGVHEYELDKVNVLCGKNGTGKSSFIKAILYGLTGEKPGGKMITDGKSQAATCVTLESGGRFSRTERTGKATVYGLGNKKVLKSAFEKAFTDETGIPLKALKVTTSSELIANMQPQEFGDFILSYTGETLTADDIVSYFDDLLEEAECKLRAVLPKDDFGIKALDKAYQTLTEERRSARRTLDAIAAVLKDRSVHTAPDESLEELSKEEASLLEAVKAISAYKAEKTAFDKALSERAKQEKLLSEAEKKLADIVINESIDLSARPELISKRDGANKKILSLTSILAKSESSIHLLEKGLADLETNACPLSDKLICKTDKTPAKQILEESLSDAKASKEAQEKLLADVKDELARATSLIEQIDTETAKRAEVEAAKTQVENIRKTLVEIPDAEPKAPEITDAEEQLKLIQGKIKAAEDAKKAEAMEKDYKETSALWQTLDMLVKALEPKGRVRSVITDSYLQVFEDICNDKASKLRPEMSVKFINDRGVHVLADMTGKGVYLEYNALSVGEQAYLMYVLMAMLNDLTGCKLLIMDELSVLDAESFDALLNLLTSNAEEYDQVFIAVVDHNDTIDSIKKYGITPLKV